MAIISIVLFAAYIPSQTDAEKKIAADDVRVRDLFRALCRPSVLAFYAECIVFGSGMAVVERLLFIYLIRDLGGSVTLAGGTVACTVLLELPIFHYADWLLRNIGHHFLICCSMTAYFTRVYGYTLLTPETVYYILPLECLHGITFASFWISAVDYTKAISPPAFVSTFQTILSVMLACVGGGIGGFVGGWAIDEVRFYERMTESDSSCHQCNRDLSFQLHARMPFLCISMAHAPCTVLRPSRSPDCCACALLELRSRAAVAVVAAVAMRRATRTRPTV